MFSKNFLRKQKHPLEAIDAMYDLAEELMNEDDEMSLIAAYKILSKLQEVYPDKGFKGALGVTLDKLDKLGLYQKIMDYEKDRDEKKQSKTNFPSKL